MPQICGRRIKMSAVKKTKRAKLQVYRAGISTYPVDMGNIEVAEKKVLNQMDFRVVKGKRRNNNKFYVIELQTDGDHWRLFTHYGRVGDAGVQEYRFPEDEEHAREEFAKILKSKLKGRSGSQGYKEVELDQFLVGSGSIPTNGEVGKSSTKTVSSKLSPIVHDFVAHIFEESTGLVQSSIETPLGALSEEQIKKGEDALNTLRFGVGRSWSPDQFDEASSHFYSIVPHRFDRFPDPDQMRLDSLEKLDKEDELLQLMGDVFRVQDSIGDSVDQQYRSLGVIIEPTNPGEEREIQEFVRKSMGGHTHIDLEIGEVLRVEIPFERKRFHGSIGNIQQLFHGTRNANHVGVLTSALRIAPASVPSTGYMFGKGIYMADRSTKSAQYAFRGDNKRDWAYLYVLDGALGRIYEALQSHHYANPPSGFDSVQGVAGSTKAWGRSGYLSYNEFIIYTVEQCTIKYIVKMKNRTGWRSY